MTNNANHAALQKALCRSAFTCLFGLFFFLCSGPASAAPPARMLGEILSKTEANYRNIHAFTAVFSQKTTSAAATLSAGEALGKLYYAKPRQMRWEYDLPEKQVFVANNHFAWLYVNAENQITLFNAEKLFASPLARTFFDGTLALKNHFNVTLDPVRSTSDVAVLELVPRQPDPNVKLAYLWIDLRNYRISRIETHDVLGNINEITISSFTPRSRLDPDLFRLEVPPGAKVFDADGHELTAAEIDKLKARIASGK